MAFATLLLALFNVYRQQWRGGSTESEQYGQWPLDRVRGPSKCMQALLLASSTVGFRPGGGGCGSGSEREGTCSGARGGTPPDDSAVRSCMRRKTTYICKLTAQFSSHTRTLPLDCFCQKAAGWYGTPRPVVRDS